MSNTAKPTHRIFAVTQREGRKADWFELGAAWAHQDGSGLQSEAESPGTELVMRTAKVKGAKPADTFESEASGGGGQ